MKRFIFTLLFGVLFIGSFAQNSSASKVRAMFLYNIVKNVEWSETVSEDHYEVVFLGSDSITDQLYATCTASYSNKEVKSGKKLNFSQVNNINEFNQADLIYVSPIIEDEVQDLISNSSKSLIVTDKSNSTNYCINFVVNNDKLSFEINNTESKVRGLEIGPSLLKMATKII